MRKVLKLYYLHYYQFQHGSNEHVNDLVILKQRREHENRDRAQNPQRLILTDHFHRIVVGITTTF